MNFCSEDSGVTVYRDIGVEFCILPFLGGVECFVSFSQDLYFSLVFIWFSMFSFRISVSSVEREGR